MVAVVWFHARPRSVQLFAASERVFGQLPEKKIDVRELFLLFAFFYFILIIFYCLDSGRRCFPLPRPFLVLATAYRIETFIWPCNFSRSLILDRPVGTVSANHLFVLYHFLPSLLFGLCVCGMSQPSHTCRIPGNDREASDLVDQSINPLMCFFRLQWSIMRTFSVSGSHLKSSKYLVSSSTFYRPLLPSHPWAVIKDETFLLCPMRHESNPTSYTE